MATGVMVAATQNGFPEQIWTKWIDYIDGSRPCLVKKPKWLGGGCAVRSPIYKYAPDARSDITPSCWAMMWRVAKARGWDTHKEMELYKGADGDVSIAEAKSCPTGYQLHLKVVDAYIKLLIGQSREYSQKVGEIASKRIPTNLFYRFIAERRVTEGMLTEFLDMAPSPRSDFGPDKNSWVWEKSNLEKELPTSCGWDFLFLGLLFLKFFR
jgi:hypothetical protein